MKIIQGRGLEKTAEILEVRLGFAGEPDNDVRSEGGVRPERPQLPENAGIIRGPRIPPHPPEDVFRRVLEGEMEVRADPGISGYEMDQLLVQRARVERAQADPAEAGDGRELAQQAGERPPRNQVPPVGRKMDPAEHDFPEAAVGQVPRAIEDPARVEAPAPSPDGRDDAE